jgi:hypothetical protein
MIKPEIIQSAITLGQKLGHVFVATADPKGLPHVAAAGRLGLGKDGLLSVAAWFCPGTVINLEHNTKISLVVWDAAADTGYQLLGNVEKVEETAIMDGYLPEMESSEPAPQVERQLHVKVDKVMGFSHAPHSDLEEG